MVNDPPPPESIIKLEGPRGEGLVSHPVDFVMRSTSIEALQARIAELLGHVSDLEDDRLLALLGALVLENALDGLLRAVLPRFGLIESSRDFSLANKTELAKAMDLIPGRILSSVDAVRGVRNDFAHHLDLKRLEDLEPKRLEAVRLRLREYGEHYVADAPTGAQLLQRLVEFTAVGLIVYTRHMEVFNRGVRNSGFWRQLMRFTGAGDSWPAA